MTSHPEFAGFEPIPMSGFNAYLGHLLRDPAKAAGEAQRFGFLPEPKHLNGSGNLHGGFLMSIADNVLGFTVHEQTDGRVASTVTSRGPPSP